VTQDSTPSRAPEPASDPLIERPLNDLGNARRLIAAHGGDLLFNVTRGTWLVWNERWWAPGNIAAEALAKRTIADEYTKLAAFEKRDSTDLFRHLRQSGNAPRIAGMLKLGQSEDGIVVDHTRLDQRPMLLNVGNGTLDLKTGRVRDFCRTDLLTRGIDIKYDASAEAPLFWAFLKRFLPSSAMRKFVQRAVGYSLTGDVGERVLLLLNGPGGNGKSTLLDTITTLMGDYAATIRPESLLVKKFAADAIPNDIAMLVDKRLVATSEFERHHRLDEPLVKRMTGGGEPLTARFMRQDWFTFHPRFKLWVGTNHLPRIRGTDQAIWDRVLVVPFNVRIPDAEKELNYFERHLRAELPGVLRWAVQGCLDWQHDGLAPPDEVRVATSSYRDNEDWLGRFLVDRCAEGQEMTVSGQALYDSYKEWAEDDGVTPLSQKAFGDQLRARGFENFKNRGDGNRSWWRGLGLLASSASQHSIWA
jgi:putative DNA primase/helicase